LFVDVVKEVMAAKRARSRAPRRRHGQAVRVSAA